MEGDRMRNRKVSTGLKQKSYVIAAVIMLAAAFGMTGIYYSQQNKKQEAKLAREQEESESLQLAEEQQEIAKNQERAERPEEKQEQETEPVSGIVSPENNDFLDSPEEVAVKEEAPQQIEHHFDAANMEWPLQGNVIMNYSMDQTVYFATLDQYKYNPAIMIQANVNTPVEAVAAGKVASIENRAETGATVTLDMGDGYSASYGQLKEIAWNKGDEIKAGEVIGYISEPTKYFTTEGANLYFALTKDGASVNPMEYLQ